MRDSPDLLLIDFEFRLNEYIESWDFDIVAIPSSIDYLLSFLMLQGQIAGEISRSLNLTILSSIVACIGSDRDFTFSSSIRRLFMWW